MEIDTIPFPVNSLELKNVSVLVRHNRAEPAAGRNIIIGDPREDDKIEKISTREIVTEKSMNGRENNRITIMPSGLGGK